MREVINEKTQRNAALMEAFDKVFKDVGSVDKAVKILAGVEAPRFYVTFEEARRIVSLMLRGELITERAERMAMYEELARRVRARWSQGEKGFGCLTEILTEPAPRFYIAPETIKGIIYREMRKRCRRGLR